MVFLLYIYGHQPDPARLCAGNNWMASVTYWLAGCKKLSTVQNIFTIYPQTLVLAHTCMLGNIISQIESTIIHMVIGNLIIKESGVPNKVYFPKCCRGEL